MAIAALDLGKRRIGVAISEGRGHPAYPLTTIERRSLKRDLAALADLFAGRNIQQVVVGLPLNLDGSEGPQARAARAFAHRLSEHLGLPTDLYDERLTSFEAEARLSEVSRSRNKAAIDALAAAIILDGWLQSRRDAGD